MSAGRSRARIAGAVALWLIATLLVALAPEIYFLAGAGESTSEGERTAISLVPVLLAWLPLAGMVGLARRNGAALRPLVPLAVACTLLAVARALGRGADPGLSGDSAWTLFWLCAAAAWIAACAVAAGRGPRAG